MISSTDNDKLKTIRKLHDKRWRERLDLFVAEGEDVVAAASWEPEFVLVAAVGEVSAPAHTPHSYVEPELLDRVSSLGSGTRVIGVFPRRWSAPGGQVSVYLQGVADPGNVGSILRSAHALCDGPVVLGPGCADPFAPKAVRAGMGSLFARPPARASFSELGGTRIALDAGGERTLRELELEPPLVLCVGAERQGLPEELLAAAEARARIPLRADGAESLNAAMAATVALYEVANRMAGDG